MGAAFFHKGAEAANEVDANGFGRVVKGLDVVQKIGKVKTDANDRPVTPVVIKKIKIVKG